MQVGDIVIYHAPEKEAYNGSTEHAALVTKVHSDTCVNLTIMPDGRSNYFRTSVTTNENDNGYFSTREDPNALQLGAAARAAGKEEAY